MTAINPATDGSPTGNAWINTLIWGGSWAPTLGEGVTLTWTTISAGHCFGQDFTATEWSGPQLDALRLALQLWADVADITFVEQAPDDPTTDLDYALVDDATMSDLTRTSGVLSFHEVPDGSYERALTGVMNDEGSGWTRTALQQGGYGFVTLIHEIGHGLGLAHPHDGGDSGETFPGVSNPNDPGTWGLNQGIFTTMSYIDGWRLEFPSHSAKSYGWQASPMAFDIAAIQTIYGANLEHNTGDDTYALPTANTAGTFWTCIWDAGGTDTLSAKGATDDALLDLRDAPLAGPNAGGHVSSVADIVGGYSIANGVVIEHALGGEGDDTLIGNAMCNRLKGGGGDDTLRGRAGADTLIGGDGADAFVFDALDAADTVRDFTHGTDTLVLENSVFTELGGRGALADTAFALGTAAGTAEERILYNGATGLLRYDADGPGGVAAVVFADIGAGLALGADAFLVA